MAGVKNDVFVNLLQIKGALDESVSMLTSQRQAIITHQNSILRRLNEVVGKKLSDIAQRSMSAQTLLERVQDLLQQASHNPNQDDASIREAIELFMKELPDLELFKPQEQDRSGISAIALDTSPDPTTTNTVTLHRQHLDTYIAKITIPSYNDTHLSLWLPSDDAIVLPSELSCEVVHSSMDDNGPLPCVIRRTNLCEFTVSFTTIIKGEYLLKVYVDFEPIRESPFSVFVRGQPSLLGSLSVPRHLAFDAFDNIVVIEWAGHRISVVTNDGKVTKSFGSKGSGPGQFIHPYGIAITLDKSVIIVSDEHRVQKLSMDGDCIGYIGDTEPGSDHAHFNYPMGVAIQPVTSHVFIADSGNNRIVVLDSDLNFIRLIDSVCFHDNSCHVTMSPCDVVFDSVGSSFYIADACSHCIMKFSLYSEEVLQIIPTSHDPCPMSHDFALTSHDLLLFPPSSVAIDSNNFIYVTQKGCGYVSIFNGDGLLIDCVGGVTSNDDCSLIKMPGSVTIDSYDTLYISDILTNQIIVC